MDPETNNVPTPEDESVEEAAVAADEAVEAAEEAPAEEAPAEEETTE